VYVYHCQSVIPNFDLNFVEAFQKNVVYDIWKEGPDTGNFISCIVFCWLQDWCI